MCAAAHHRRRRRSHARPVQCALPVKLACSYAPYAYIRAHHRLAAAVPPSLQLSTAVRTLLLEAASAEVVAARRARGGTATLQSLGAAET